ncbi:phosphoenolpyruvate--protein phosphotransferase [Deltaproteobacteria bacterium TL4]
MKRDYLNLLCDVGELISLLAGSTNIENFLQRLVITVSHHLNTNVCSIYLYDDMAKELVLRATTGLKHEMIGIIRLKEGEGLVGMTLKERHPILDNHASKNPHFKYFPEAGEEPFESFLATPILRENEKIGVLVLRRLESNYFGQDDVVALRAIAAQLAGTIENARILLSFHEEHQPHQKNKHQIKMMIGEVASTGFCYGSAEVLSDVPGLFTGIEQDVTNKLTLQDLLLAIEKTSQQIEQLQIHIAERLPEVVSLIFNVHLLMLKDQSFTGAMIQKVEDGMAVVTAVQQVTQYFVGFFSNSQAVYMREKSKDVKDVSRRIMDNLSFREETSNNLMKGTIIIARDLYPSDIVKFTIEGIVGMVLVGGGLTSHISIIARSLHIPLIIVENEALLSIKKGSLILIDGEGGTVYIEPTRKIVQTVSKSNQTKKQNEILFEKMRETTLTADGCQIHLMANINLLSEVSLASQLKIGGIGLYRTEFPFLVRHSLPSEEEQYQIYAQLFKQMEGKEITFRTLDVGGEKSLSYYDQNREANPELGLRSIRFSFEHRDIFEQQIRAILRAGTDATNFRIMFPMISSLDDFRLAKQVVLDCITQLKQELLPHHRKPAIGMMVELPSVVETIDEFAREVDFFSIGTNDFIQFMLAVDRANEKVASYYCGHHPAVLRALAKIVSAALKENKDISVCGEMAHQEEYIPFLLGIGIRKLSVDPQFIPKVQAYIEKLAIFEVETNARLLLKESSIAGIEKILHKHSSKGNRTV